MKKALLFVSFMLFFTTMSYAQEEFLTVEEKTVTEKDLDDAYVAPSSKFIGKKWYYDEIKYIIFNSNGTWKSVATIIDDDYGDPIHVTIVDQGLWKRDKQYLNITEIAKNRTYIPDASELKKFSFRKQDQIKQDWAKVQRNYRKKLDGHSKSELRKVTSDYLIIGYSYEDGKSGTLYLYSKKKLDERKNENKNRK